MTEQRNKPALLGLYAPERGRNKSLPESVDCPRIGWPCDWVGIPELGLQQCTARVIVAASGSLGGTVAAQSVVIGASLDSRRNGGCQGEQADRGARKRHDS